MTINFAMDGNRVDDDIKSAVDFLLDNVATNNKRFNVATTSGWRSPDRDVNSSDEDAEDEIVCISDDDSETEFER